MNVLFVGLGLRKWIKEDMRVKVLAVFKSICCSDRQCDLLRVSNGFANQNAVLQAHTAFERQSGTFSKFALSIWDHTTIGTQECHELKVGGGALDPSSALADCI